MALQSVPVTLLNVSPTTKLYIDSRFVNSTIFNLYLLKIYDVSFTGKVWPWSCCISVFYMVTWYVSYVLIFWLDPFFQKLLTRTCPKIGTFCSVSGNIHTHLTTTSVISELDKCLYFTVRTCVHFKELRRIHLDRHFVFEWVSSSYKFSLTFFPRENHLKIRFLNVSLKRYFLKIHIYFLKDSF